MIESFFKSLDYTIPTALKPFILAVVQGDSLSNINITYPVHANGFPLLINVYGDMPKLHLDNHIVQPTSRINLAGQVIYPYPNIEIDGRFGQIGFVLQPSALYYLFHKPGSYFLNQWRSIEEISPLPTGDLVAELDTIELPGNRIAVLFAFFERLAKQRSAPIEWLDRAIFQILRKDGIIGQADIANRVDISLRHFRRKFKEVVGVSPKYFSKVIQINTIFELHSTSNTEKLHHLALDCGYYDQAHFINDFNRFIGKSPAQFLEGKHSFVKSYLGRATNIIK